MTKQNSGKTVFYIFLILLFGIGFCRVVYAQNNIELVKQKWLIEQYDKFAIECYADSSFVRVHEPEMIKMHGSYIPKEFCLVDWVCMTESHYKNKWIHKQPTFEGFIEWLKKQ